MAMIIVFLAAMSPAAGMLAQLRFPPPDFESGYKFPETTTPPGRAEILQYLDAAVLAACLGIALWFIYGKRSRRGLFWLSVFSLGYFGFYRKGCICPIGSPQNIIYGLFNPGYAVPLTVVAFFVLPLFVALLAGRAFCAGVCPQGALQDFFLIKAVKVPAWLEHGLSVLPFIFLGAGLAYAATGTGFIICRYDPFVPIFRLSGNLFILSTGVAFLLTAMFVGRPYCRFLCPYGALLKLASQVSKWRVRVTPDFCTQCRLCESSCPFGAMREPSASQSAPVAGVERARLGWMLALLPVLIAGGALAGGHLSSSAAQLHPGVALAEQYVRQQKNPVQYGAMTPDALSLARAEKNPEAVLAAAEDLRRRFKLATVLFGGWVGLVFGVKLIALSVRPQRTDFEPDRGACFACARCFAYCPNELTRLGHAPAAAMPVAGAATAATGGGP
jgi:ferredoxin